MKTALYYFSMILFLIVSTTLFAVTIVCTVLLIVFIRDCRLVWTNPVYTFRFWKYIVIGLTSLLVSIWCFTIYVHRVQNDAIEHYISGDYELIEKKVNDQVIDSYYRLIKTNYD